MTEVALTWKITPVCKLDCEELDGFAVSALGVLSSKLSNFGRFSDG
jgi:hypothetical protein